MKDFFSVMVYCIEAGHTVIYYYMAMADKTHGPERLLSEVECFPE